MRERTCFHERERLVDTTAHASPNYQPQTTDFFVPCLLTFMSYENQSSTTSNPTFLEFPANLNSRNKDICCNSTVHCPLDIMSCSK